ncbi:Clavesin-1 [Eumeta japonica]|uniref:Clavesin-1 n=1 Tax=Eumeta variegata TaxID=151549 RepID=A0A4C1U651_EUMVA|nr:Clavesin-1 [Eumeta japonica]
MCPQYQAPILNEKASSPVATNDIKMRDVFREIAFQAEVSTYEDPEFEELALELCNERPETRTAAIAELRETILERGECVPHRMDDAFLLRFLRARRFVIPRAYRLECGGEEERVGEPCITSFTGNSEAEFRALYRTPCSKHHFKLLVPYAAVILMVRYYKFREDYPHLQRDVDLFGLARVGGAYGGMYADHPRVGRITVLRFGAWDPSEIPVEDVVRAGMLLLEIGIRQPKLQVLGGLCIVDLEGISIRHMRTVTPAIAHQIVSLIGTSLPTRVRSCHLINYSWIFNAFSYLFKTIIPSYAWKQIHFHGRDLNSLYAHVPQENLPPHYGGTCDKYVEFGHWLNKIKKYRDQQFDDEMRALGYLIKE